MESRKLQLLVVQGQAFIDELHVYHQIGEKPKSHIHDLTKWQDRALAFIRGVDQSLLEDITSFESTDGISKIYPALTSIVSLLKALAAMEVAASPSAQGAIPAAKAHDSVSLSKSVFVVHGHNEAMKQTVARYLQVLGMSPIILHEQVNKGNTIIEKFEHNAAQAGFAVVLMSADDVGGPANKTEPQRPRARQNVVVELGYFSALLGRDKVCVLVSDEIEIPSDYLGVVYTKFDSSGGWKLDLARELESAGYTIDARALLK
jgi:predicted nucleotide-binding protein